MCQHRNCNTVEKAKALFKDILTLQTCILKAWCFFSSRWERSAVRFTVLVQSTTFLLLLDWLGKLAEHTYFCISKGSSAPTWFMSLFLSMCEISNKCYTPQRTAFSLPWWAFIDWFQTKVLATRMRHVCKNGALSYGPDLVIIKSAGAELNSIFYYIPQKFQW